MAQMKATINNSVDRVIDAIKYYEKLNIEKEADQDKLITFCEHYNKQFVLLDDVNVLTTKYNNSSDLDTLINKYKLNINTCNIQNCLLFKRHNILTNTSSKAKEIAFYMTVFDGLHCFLYHCWDIGMRVAQNDIECVGDDAESFSNIRNTINSKKRAINHIFGENIKRFNNSNNKFNLKNINNQIQKKTFMDALHERLHDNNTPMNMIQDEQYDTDAIESDITFGDSGNIKQFVQQKQDGYEIIFNFLSSTKREQQTFSIGYTFYYWPYYEHVVDNNTALEMDDEKVQYGNINDQHGYKKHELYVAAKYNDIKEEVLHNNVYNLSMGEYALTAFKANQLVNTQKVRHMKSAKFAEERLHFNVGSNANMKFEHVLCVSFYCDWTELCTKFSATFRKNDPFEPIEKMKARNSQFANFARLLRETVEYFGRRGQGDKNEENEYVDRVNGPFYCGMSITMAMPAFNIRLNSPTSTSMQIEVAVRFADDKGMIMQLNNNWHTNADMLRIFCCNWISNFKGEDEYLFIGGMYQIRIQSIRILNTKPATNYKSFCGALFHFDCMIKGTNMEQDDVAHIGKYDYKILNNLIRCKLDNSIATTIDKYIHDCFAALCKLYTQIVLNLHELNTYFNSLKRLIIYEENNIFKELILDLFQNVDNIIIYTTEQDGGECYEVDLLQLLASFGGIHPYQFTITMKATRQEWEQETESWLYQAFQENKQEIETYHNVIVILTETKDHEGIIEDCLVIKKSI